MTLAGRNADRWGAIAGGMFLAWIAVAAVRAEEPVKQPFGENDRSHWAYQPLQVAAPPAVNKTDWPENPIDLHILSRLEKNKLAPSPEADRRTLIRRATMLLWGVPPTVEE